jgi:sigma-B regulation protein RsbU (phosphoserine phosphatase)
MIRPIDGEPSMRQYTFDARSRALAQATAVAFTFFVIAGAVEALVIRIIQPTELELDWVSDVVLSAALGSAVYLWLHLRATRLALTERERAALVIQTQLSLAEAMQRRLLPIVPLPARGFEWAARLTPAGKIGGDFYDFIEPIPGIRLLLIADVSGKGISAAMALALLRSTFRNIARDAHNPAQLADRMSAAFYEEWQGSPYVTCVVARVDLQDRTLTYTNAGHPPGVLVRDGADRGLSEGGPPLGLLKDAQYFEERLELRVGDVCIFVTDGITEAFDDALLPFHDVLAATVGEDSRSATGICDAIMARALEGHGPHGVDNWTDDRTVVVFAVGKADGE